MFTKYRELGLSLIPIKIGAKRPDCSPFDTEGWQRYCDTLPTEEEAETWDTIHHRYGLACGKASGVMAVDIDTDDKEVLNACPLSPVIKRGRKGETRFFRFDGKVQSCKVAGIIDILCSGKQTLLPPTIHHEIDQPYVWLTPDTLENYDIRDLPLFTDAELDQLRRSVEKKVAFEPTNTIGVEISGGPWFNTDPKRGCPHGSHDRLKAIANAMIGRGVSPDDAVRELLRYDDENHKPVTYFSDTTRPDCVADPVTNALFFYASNLKTFNRRQVQQGNQPSIPLVSGTEVLEIGGAPPIIAEAWQPLAWPEPQGLLKEIRDQILDYSLRDQPGLALGGAIAIGAAALSNRMKLGDAWPNVYVLNVAQTGAGKSFPYGVAKRILNPENDLDLLGASGYRSSTALIKDLVGRRERLDLIDECSGLFKMVRDGGVFQTEMLDMLNALWAESKTIYLGPESAGRERVNVWHPCISVLFSTTPSNLKISTNSEFISGGFIPRCLIFHDAEYGKIGKSVWDENRADKIVKGLHYFKEFRKDDKKNLVSPKPDPMDCPISTAAQKMLEDYHYECASQLQRGDTEELEKNFLTRAAEQATKLALIHGALRGLMVDVIDVQWAVNTLQVCWHNSSPIMPQMGAENAQEGNVLRVLQIIKRSGSIGHSRLIGKTRFLRTSERTEILASLEAEGKISTVLAENRSRVYNFIS